MNLDFIKNNRVILLFIFALLRNEYFCQEKKDSAYKWGVGLSSSLNYSRFIYNKSAQSQLKNYIILAPGMNLHLQKKLTNFFYVSIGLNYFKLKNEIRTEDPFSTYSYKSNIEFLSLPLGLLCGFGKKKIRSLIKIDLACVMLANRLEKFKMSSYKKIKK